MEMTGEQRLPAPREVVWAALNDPEVLKQSIPGCEEIERLSDTEMTAKVAAKVGPVSARFTGQVTLSDLDPPNGYTISGEGKGGVAGFAKGGAKVRLEADGDGTLMRYEVTASVGGKLAQIGARLIDATAKKMADDFFSRFSALIAARSGGAPAATAPSPEAAAPAMPPPALGSMLGDAGAPRSGLSPMTWASLIVVIVLIVLIFVTR
ncbi:MAG: carbon monoxide dehydrogenase subunit G [Alphaproteobacteria bacterium]|nr:carbon monoxide dehydrogenase subunit G [Alphaproteobacteria bacterium]